MTILEYIGVAQAVALYGIWFRLGGILARVQALEEWRRNVDLSAKRRA